MKIFLRYIRSFLPLNWIVRCFVKSMSKIMIVFFEFCSKHWILSGTATITLPREEKFKIYSKGDDFIPNKLFWGGYDAYESSMYFFYHFAKKSSIIFDIGANIGVYSLVASAANPSSEIFAFEPVSRVYQRLLKQIKINSLSNIHTEMTAVSSKSGEITLYVPIGNAMALASSATKGWYTGAKEQIVKSVSLDDYKKINNIGKIDLIKIDVEFHEAEILMGMSSILKEDRPIILCEVLLPDSEGVSANFNTNNFIKVEEIIKSYGYFIYVAYAKALVKVPKLDYNPFDRNYIFLPYELPDVFNVISK